MQSTPKSIFEAALSALHIFINTIPGALPQAIIEAAPLALKKFASPVAP
jgi:hypothetical protein